MADEKAIMVLISGLLLRNLNLKTLGEQAAREHEEKMSASYPMTPQTPLDDKKDTDARF